MFQHIKDNIFTLHGLITSLLHLSLLLGFAQCMSHASVIWTGKHDVTMLQDILNPCVVDIVPEHQRNRK